MLIFLGEQSFHTPKLDLNGAKREFGRHFEKEFISTLPQLVLNFV